MANLDSVSILIPTRNRSAILAKCLAALPEGARGLAPPEVIVVDDCSTDATPEIVEAFRRSADTSETGANSISLPEVWPVDNAVANFHPGGSVTEGANITASEATPSG